MASTLRFSELLLSHELSKEAALAHEFIVASLFNDTALVQTQDAVATFNKLKNAFFQLA